MESKDLKCLLAFSHFYNKNNVLIYFKVICDLMYFGSLVPDTKMAGAAVSRSGLESSPRKRKVVCSNPSRDRHNS